LLSHSGIAQLVEHLTVNQVVVSSSLTAGVIKTAVSEAALLFFCINQLSAAGGK
jgi:hypothetical protein